MNPNPRVKRSFTYQGKEKDNQQANGTAQLPK